MMRLAARALGVCCLSLATAPAAGSDARSYDLHYQARLLPGDGHAEGRITLDQPTHLVRLLDFRAPAGLYSGFSGDGDVRRDGDRLVWEVPQDGGSLEYRVRVDHCRDGAFDARMTEDWAVARLDDLFPTARVEARSGSDADASFSLRGPDGWSFETGYGPVDDEPVAFDTAGRRFDRPLGWLAAGELGIRRTEIAGRRIAIAGPRDQGFRRLDLLAFLRWTLPELVRVAPSLPERVLIAGGAAGMWRGGLSGPNSLYVHPDRPLISGDMTSPILHELVHVAMAEPPADGDDWIVEGVADYYSLVVPLRAGGISGRRFERALAGLEARARDEAGRLADPSTGADTARAVLLFRDLDLELAAAGARLDAVVAELLGGHRVSRRRLARLTAAALGRPSRVLARALEAAPEPD